ncbi:MAG TPA: cytochrome c [Opitutaceae bacterium]
MKHPIATFAGAAGLAVLGTLLLANSAPDTAAPPDRDALVKRGEYIVNGVGLCADCHTPRGPNGQFIEGMHLKGAAITVAPTVPMPAWATVAPWIAGLPAGWSEEQMARFLVTGERPYEMPAVLPPMPPYRMNDADAAAVSAYLLSLAKTPK